MASDLENSLDRDELLRMTAEIVAAFVSYNTLSIQELPAVIKSVNQTLIDLKNSEAQATEEKQKPAVSIKRSIHNDYLICLEDGKKLKMLKRYLRTKYELSPDDYRQKWGLSADYPMVAPNYSKQRSNFAKTIGLGRRAR
jgi:predicted transcriptional regulator